MLQQKSSIHFNPASIKNHLEQRIFGQEHVVDQVLDTLCINFAGLGDANKPLASFLFTGPTGVGKTEFSIELAKKLGLKFLRYDMSEYADEYSTRNLTGGNAGLVGYEDGGLLTNDVMKYPNSVILLDEIEKAHPKTYNSFLQVLDYGTLTDTKGNKARFHKCIIIMTSNLGTNEKAGIGFGNNSLHKEKAVLDFLTPEFRNRIDKILAFNALEKYHMKKIIDKFVKDFASALHVKNIALSVSDDAKLCLQEIAHCENMGARAAIRAINNSFKKEIAKQILSGKKFTSVRVDIEEDAFICSFENTYQPKQQQQVFDFETADEAHQYAKENIGVAVARSPSGVGYIIKR